MPRFRRTCIWRRKLDAVNIRENTQGREHTVTSPLVVVRNELGTFADTLAVRTNTTAVQRIGARSTFDAVVGRRAATGFASGVALFAAATVGKAPVGAGRPSRSLGGLGNALGLVVGVLSEAAFASGACSGSISACCAADSAN